MMKHRTMHEVAVEWISRSVNGKNCIGSDEMQKCGSQEVCTLNPQMRGQPQPPTRRPAYLFVSSQWPISDGRRGEGCQPYFCTTLLLQLSVACTLAQATIHAATATVAAFTNPRHKCLPATRNATSLSQLPNEPLIICNSLKYPTFLACHFPFCVSYLQSRLTSRLVLTGLERSTHVDPRLVRKPFHKQLYKQQVSTPGPKQG
jgi:hypothetical protein